jgi:hypothetical protein
VGFAFIHGIYQFLKTGPYYRRDGIVFTMPGFDT